MGSFWKNEPIFGGVLTSFLRVLGKKLVVLNVSAGIGGPPDIQKMVMISF